MFRFVIRGGNCAAYVNDCISGLCDQTIHDWHATVIVDPSNDGTEDLVTGWAARDLRIRVKINDKPKGVCENLYDGIKLVCEPHHGTGVAIDDDIIGILDLDDYLFRNEALQIVNSIYQDRNIMCTYGSYRYHSNGDRGKNCKEYPKGVKVREHRWLASHLKTFRAAVVKHIPEDCFRHKGHWGKAASDLALMFAVIERVGLDRTQFIDRTLYCYRDNSGNPVRRKTQKLYRDIWKAKKPLKRLF